jgi:hypothetical protein
LENEFLITAEDVKVMDDKEAEIAAAAAILLAEKNVIAKAQSKIDKAAAMVTKRANHVAHKERRAASIAAFAEAAKGADAPIDIEEIAEEVVVDEVAPEAEA